MIRILSLQATPNADLKMWIDALPCHYHDDDDDHDHDDHDEDHDGMTLTNLIPLD